MKPKFLHRMVALLLIPALLQQTALSAQFPGPSHLRSCLGAGALALGTAPVFASQALAGRGVPFWSELEPQAKKIEEIEAAEERLVAPRRNFFKAAGLAIGLGALPLVAQTAAIPKITDAQRLNLLAWQKALLARDETEWEKLLGSARNFDDKEWVNAAVTFITRLRELNAHLPHGLAAEEQYAMDYLTASRSYSEFLRRRGWAINADPTKLNILEFGRIESVDEVRIIPEGTAAPTEYRTPVIRATFLDMETGKAAPVTPDMPFIHTFGQGNTAWMVIWQNTFEALLTEMAGFADPRSTLSRKTDARFAAAYRECLNRDQLLEDNHLTIATPDRASARDRIERTMIFHEGGHVLKSAPHGIMRVPEEETFEYFNEILSSEGHTRLAQFILWAATYPGGIPDLAMHDLAGRLGDKNPLTKNSTPTLEDYTALLEALLALRPKDFQSLVTQARDEAGSKLHGPSRWRVIFPDGTAVSPGKPIAQNRPANSIAPFSAIPDAAYETPGKLNSYIRFKSVRRENWRYVFLGVTLPTLVFLGVYYGFMRWTGSTLGIRDTAGLLIFATLFFGTCISAYSALFFMQAHKSVYTIAKDGSVQRGSPTLSDQFLLFRRGLEYSLWSPLMAAVGIYGLGIAGRASLLHQYAWLAFLLMIIAPWLDHLLRNNLPFIFPAVRRRFIAKGRPFTAVPPALPDAAPDPTWDLYLRLALLDDMTSPEFGDKERLLVQTLRNKQIDRKDVAKALNRPEKAVEDIANNILRKTKAREGRWKPRKMVVLLMALGRSVLKGLPEEDRRRIHAVVMGFTNNDAPATVGLPPGTFELRIVQLTRKLERMRPASPQQIVSIRAARGRRGIITPLLLACIALIGGTLAAGGAVLGAVVLGLTGGADGKTDKSDLLLPDALTHLQQLAAQGVMTQICVGHGRAGIERGQTAAVELHESDFAPAAVQIQELLKDTPRGRKFTVLVRDELGAGRIAWLLPQIPGTIPVATRVAALDAYKALPVYIPPDRIENLHASINDLIKLLPEPHSPQTVRTYIQLLKMVLEMQKTLENGPTTEKDVLNVMLGIREFTHSIIGVSDPEDRMEQIQTAFARVRAYLDPETGLIEFTPTFYKHAEQFDVVGLVDPQGKLYVSTLRMGIYANPDHPEETLDVRDPEQIKRCRSLTLSSSLPFNPNDLPVVPTAPFPRQGLFLRREGEPGRDLPAGPEYEAYFLQFVSRQMQATFPGASMDDIMKTVGPLGVVTGKKILTSSPALATLFACQGAHVVLVYDDPALMAEIKKDYSSYEAVARIEGGQLQFVEGRLADPAVRAYLAHFDGFDHIALPQMAVKPAELAALKTRDSGWLYLEGTVKDAYIRGLQNAGLGLRKYERVLTPGSARQIQRPPLPDRTRPARRGGP